MKRSRTIIATVLSLITVLLLFNCVKKENYLSPLTGIQITDVAVEPDATAYTINISGNLSRYVVASHIDLETNEEATWIEDINLKQDKKIVFKFEQNLTMKDRTAHVTLSLDGSRDDFDDAGLKVEFNVMQRHNNVFDSLMIDTLKLAWDETTDTLVFRRTLKGIKTEIVYDDVNSKTSWLKVELDGNLAILKAQKNNTGSPRSADVTLFMSSENVESNSVKISFNVVQDFHVTITPERRNLIVDHSEHTEEIKVESNAKYIVDKDVDWVSCDINPINETTEILALNFAANRTNKNRVGNLIFKVGGIEQARITVTQRTDPAISITFKDKRESMTFSKSGGVFNLPIKTLTPDYRYSKKQAWLSIGSKQAISDSLYYHEVTVKDFTGDSFERFDTIVFTTYNDTVRFPIMQHKYVYLNEAAHELEKDSNFDLNATAMGDRPVLWSSEHPSIATVDENGKVTALKKGETRIYATISSNDEYKGYSDFCTVSVFEVPDKVNIRRQAGAYEELNGYVVSECPVSVRNDYSKTIEIESATLYGIRGKRGQSGDYTQELGASSIGSGKSHTFQLQEKLDSIVQPKVVISIKANGKNYTKTVNY